MTPRADQLSETVGSDPATKPPAGAAMPVGSVQREALRALVDLVDTATARESEIDQQHDASLSRAQRDHAKAVAALEEQARSAIEALHADHGAEREKILADHQRALGALQAQHEQSLRQLHLKHDPVAQKYRQEYEQAKWLAETVLEAAQNQLRDEHRQVQQEVEEQREALGELQNKAFALLHRYGQNAATIASVGEPAEIDPASAQSAFQAHHQAAGMNLSRLESLALPGLFVGVWPFVIAILIGLLAAVGGQVYAAGVPRADFVPQWTEIGIALAIAAGGLVIAGVVLKLLGNTQVRKAYAPLRFALEQAERALSARLAHAASLREQRLVEAQQRSRDEVRAAKERFGPKVKRADEAHQQAARAEKAAYQAQRNHLSKQHEDALAQADRKLHDAEAAAARQQQEALEQVTARRDADIQSADAAHAAALSALEQHWMEGLTQIQAPITSRSRNGPQALTWDDPSWEHWTPPERFPPTVRFGELQVDLAQITDATPRRLRLPERFTVPASLSFSRQGSLLIQTDRAGHDAAIDALRMVMTRLLTSIPPGRARFTLIDPVALGQNFAGFMHLADYDEALVGGRIWTESDHIEQQLANLTEHMETVIQKYLRNEFETIDDYNAQAGELAEPYRFLVIADFPHAFEGDAYRRLASICASGARCGVYTLIVRDLRLSVPSGVHLDELEHHSVNLVARAGRFAWKDEVFEQFPLQLDPAPGEEMLTRLMQRVGEGARQAKRVEVPFSTIAPDKGEFWSGDATSELRVPIGRSGATRSQSLRLGRGVAQHALIAGKTGSGKSTLLHALVTNLAMWYSPDEVEFYLVDFKKGVEFKTYATHQLPHARAIAVESDREFGLSVLQRMDGELTRRGDLFRRLGVQDLGGYRAAAKDDASLPKLPRTLLIVDEFQEFFSEDDKLAQDAGLLLDRLVRQGRAFGIHVLLGSQTIGGTSGLARTTIGQMAVRIALQTSEADSQLILGDNNSAARLLSRPGEAIYNDAGGLVEGNSPFQIAWLPDAERDAYLDRVLEQAKGLPPRHEPPAIFEGNAPADLMKNQPLMALLNAPNWPERTTAPQAWMGEPVAIKAPTSITFRRQSGANVLLVGQQEEQALSILLASMLSLAAQHRPDEAMFWIFDGTAADSPLAGRFEQFAGALPHATRLIDYRAAPDAIGEITAELAARQSAEAPPAASHYVLIYALQRYRVLRKTEESFSFSMDDEPKAPAPDKQFADLLREGPSLGIHTLTWCDTAAGVDRTLDRASMREFDHRVLFQMSAADSSVLIDSPAANKLGFYRALAYSEEQGVMERFRPYALPGAALIESVRQHLHR